MCFVVVSYLLSCTLMSPKLLWSLALFVWFLLWYFVYWAISTSNLTVSCEDWAISVIAHDVTFGTVVNSYSENLILSWYWLNSAEGSGIVISDTKSNCNEDIDEDGDIWDISIWFGNMYASSWTQYLYVTGVADYAWVGDVINVTISIHTSSWSALESSQLTQLAWPSTWSVKVRWYDNQTVIGDQSLPLISRAADELDAGIGQWEFVPDIILEIPPYIPIGSYQWDMFLYINEW